MELLPSGTSRHAKTSADSLLQIDRELPDAQIGSGGSLASSQSGDVESEDDDEWDPDRSSTMTTSPSSNFEEQLATAGLTLKEKGMIPGGHFPHTPYVGYLEPEPVLDQKQTDKADETLGSHGYFSVKRKHLAVLTVVLHKCILEGDFIRAGRAWGNLLRQAVKGTPMNFRINGMWAVGAEILFRSHVLDDASHADDEKSSVGSNQDEEMDTQVPTFSKEGFEKAKEYYERLILHYPYRFWYRNAISVLQFYPAMFGLWIFNIQSEQKAALASIERSNGNDDDDVSRSLDFQPPDRSFERELIRKHALREGEQIAVRLDDLMASMPFSENSNMWKLKAMVALWLRDLCVSLKDDGHLTESSESLHLDSRSDCETASQHSEVSEQDMAIGKRSKYETAAQEALENAERFMTAAIGRSMSSDDH